ncbi:MAG: adenylate/guanylate cyclase domain-containing protein [Alphaproteobacteria bacterium]|nr:adenylate/guanylate cyclase domain-containing protein [Alphaproteobacteria bacterium]
MKSFRAPRLSMPAPVAAALRAEEIAGQRLFGYARFAVLAGLTAVTLILQPAPYAYYNLGPIFLIALVGLAPFVLSQARERRGLPYLFFALDVILITLWIWVFNPAIWDGLVPEMLFAWGIVTFYFLLIVLAALSYDPKLPLWTGALSAGAVLIVYVVIAARDGAVDSMMLMLNAGTLPPDYAQFSASEHFGFAAIPRILEAAVLLLAACVVAVAVQRSRRLVVREAEAARGRANLSRYFSPAIVDELLATDAPLGAVRTQPVAVLFADIVGFTRIAETQSAEDVIDLLRGFHQRMENAVFAHGGTLDKFLGDGLMATFGTPHTGLKDTINALACLRAMLAAIDLWNAERAVSGDNPLLQLSIGLHFGMVVLGDIGSERQLEFAVVGDVVNVASRLEELTRTMKVRAVISEAFVEALHEQAGSEANALLAGVEAQSPQILRGRSEAVAVRTLV